MGLRLLPPAPERLWTLNALEIPEGVDDLRLRAFLRDQHNIEIGAGMGPLAGRIWRIGLMGASADAGLVLQLLASLEHAFARQGRQTPAGAGTAAAVAALSAAS